MTGRRTPVALLAAGLVALAAPAASLGATRYASPNGTGPAASCPQSDPCDLKTAVGGALDGDQVLLLGGDYVTTEEIDTNRAIAIGKAPGVVGMPRLISTNRLKLTSADARVADLRIDHDGSAGEALVVSGLADRVVVESMTAIFACSLNDDGATLQNSVCHARSTAFGAVAVAVVPQTGGMTASVSLHNVTAWAGGPGCGVSAFAAVGGTTTVSASNVIAHGGGVDACAEVVDGGTATLTLDHSNYATEEELGTGAQVTDPGAPANQTDQPLLADPGTGDFHQIAGSPTIDAGDNAAARGPADIDGAARTQGSAVDIGADELGDAPADLQPPETTIISGPAEGGVTDDFTPTFGLASSEAGSTFECRFDAAPFAPCSDGDAHTPALSLAQGAHSFEARATDPAGNTDPTAAVRSFAVDTTGDTELALQIKGKRLTLNRKRKIKVKVRCPASEQSGPCAAKLKLRTRNELRVKKAKASAAAKKKAKRKRIVLAKQKQWVKVGAGKTRKVTLRLSKRNARLVRKRKQARKVLVIARGRDRAGNRATVKKKARVVPRKGRRK